MFPRNGESKLAITFSDTVIILKLGFKTVWRNPVYNWTCVYFESPENLQQTHQSELRGMWEDTANEFCVFLSCFDTWG